MPEEVSKFYFLYRESLRLFRLTEGVDRDCFIKDFAVSVRKHQLSLGEISQAFAGKAGADFPVILSPVKLASLFALSPKTIYEWIARGRLDGAFRKRGKHVLIWRDRALEIIFNGKDWSSNDSE